MADGPFHRGRHAGVLVPLFSIPSRESWGVGEIADLPLFARWLAAAGLDLVQLLPVNEMEEGQNSPYSALSAMAIDPVFIALRDVEEFAAAGGEAALDPADRARLDEARHRPAVDFGTVRALKRVAFHLAFHVFRERLAAGTARAADFQAFAGRERWWLDDYALFRALHDEHHGCYWRDWEPELRNRDLLALDRARLRLADTILYYQYLQWLADTQWRRARRECGRVGIFGDFPFMVSGHSADVWSRQHQFRIDASVGVPPDAFSESGQDWGLPVYRWEVDRGRTTTTGCGSAPGAAPISTTASASITSSASIAPTCASATAARISRPPTSRRRRPRASASSPSSASGAPASSPKISASSLTSYGSRWRGSESPG